jgi:hypothetical protein
LFKETKANIEKKAGKYDQDGFYLLDEPKGAFYDPHGYYFDKDGLDASGGHYDNYGYYIAGRDIEKVGKVGRSNKLEALSRQQIHTKHPDGKYDEDDFYVLKDAAFYDPFGYYFDSKGNDAVGGYYDKEGFYVNP